MYRWIVFIHIASVLGLLLVHPVTVAFHLKQERNDIRIRELLEVSEAASMLRWVFFGLTIVSGVVLGFMGSWWGTAWIWAALAIFIAIGLVMNLYGGRTIDRLEQGQRASVLRGGLEQRKLPSGRPDRCYRLHRSRRDYVKDRSRGRARGSVALSQCLPGPGLRDRGCHHRR